jgi:hypothetical protein
VPGENAVITAITGPGSPDESGDPRDDGAVLWSGRAWGYLKRSDRTVLSGGNQVKVQADVFTVLDTAGAPLLAESGPDWTATTVTIEDHRKLAPVTRTFRVDAMEHRAAGTVADSVRLELDEVGD